jgi:hypothetical protein
MIKGIQLVSMVIHVILERIMDAILNCRAVQPMIAPEGLTDSWPHYSNQGQSTRKNAARLAAVMVRL